MTSLYIHIPFCERKCFYCSFTVSVGQTQAIDRYLDCLSVEAKAFGGPSIGSIYIGGGTPTFMSTDQLHKLFCVIRKEFRFKGSMEWTIEANPEDMDTSKLKMIKESGVNRVSLGVQSLNDGYLKYLGRNHNAASAVAAFDRIRAAGFKNVNVDLMFAFPDQKDSELNEDIQAVTQLGSEHLSIYSLSVDQNSKFYARHVQLKGDQSQARQYKLVCEKLKGHGYGQYEVSNFAKRGFESAHNINYWQGGEYIGLGVGAHSHRGNERSWNISRLQQYLSDVEEGLSVREGHEVLTAYEGMKETVLFGLRMNGGVDLKQVENRFSCELKEHELQKIDDFIDGGLLIRDNDRLKASLKGLLVLDELCAQLI